MKVLLLEPYYGGSHRAWADGYAVHSDHDVTFLTLPARFWKWRMQGGALTLAEQARSLAFQPDLILASDMLNLPAFLGLTRDSLSGAPAVLYCHENQLTYPCPPGEKRDLTYGMINWLSMVVADRIFFNSLYHQEDWFTELPRLLRHFPDHTHAHRIAEVRAKADVLPVGCDLRRFDHLSGLQGSAAAPTSMKGSAAAPTSMKGSAAAPTRMSGSPPLILWNQRWEYDKDPETFFRALYLLDDEGLDFRVALAGKSHRQAAPEFEAARERLGDRVFHFGYSDEAQYRALLCQADVVVSTAIHEFFGVAVVEAVYCGCFPVLPRRLAYPELISSSHHEAYLYRDFEGLLRRLRWALTHLGQARALAADLRPAVARFDWAEMGPRYDRLMAGVVQRFASLPFGEVS